MHRNLRDFLFQTPLLKQAGLQYVWPLDEATGLVRQSYSPPWACVPSAHLLPVNGPTQGSALISGPAGSCSFTAASVQKLTTQSLAALVPKSSFWLAIWYNQSSNTGTQGIVMKYTGGGYYYCTVGGAPYWHTDGNSDVVGSALTAGSTNFVLCYMDLVGKKNGIYVNGAATPLLANASAVLPANNVSLEFSSNQGSISYFGGSLGPVMMGVPQPGFTDWAKLSKTLYANGSGLDLVRRLPLPYPPGRPLIGVEPIVWCEADYGTYQTSGGSAATADGDPVGYWTDRSVFRNHPVQATSTKRPTLKLNILNGYPVLRFDGVDDFLLTAAFAGVVSQPTTIFCVTKVVAVAGATFLWAGSTARNDFLLSVGTIDMYAGSDTSAGTYTTGSWVIYIGQYNGASSFSRVNGTQSANVNPGSQGLDKLAIGAYSDGSYVLNGDVAAVFVYPGALTAAQITAVESYLNTKYAVY